MKTIIYHYCATYPVANGVQLIDGIAKASDPIESGNDLRQLKSVIASDYDLPLSPDDIVFNSLTKIGEKNENH